MTPFDYLNTINDTKQDIMETELDERSYVPFVINRSLSYFADTVGLANVVNQHHHIDKKLQYHFLINIIRKRKRFSKWIKPDLVSGMEVVKQYYGYSNDKARQVFHLLSPEQIEELRKKVSKGGRK
jgi:hypothetical protein